MKTIVMTSSIFIIDVSIKFNILTREFNISFFFQIDFMQNQWNYLFSSVQYTSKLKTEYPTLISRRR